MYARFLKIVEKSLHYTVISLTGSIIIIITYQVFGRYVLQHSPSWTEEVARILLVWISFLGSSLLVRHKNNIKLEVIIKKYFSSTAQKKFALFAEILIMVFSALTLKLGFDLMMRNRGYTTEALHLPMLLFTLPLPLSSVCILFFSWGNIFEKPRILRTKK